MARGCFNPQPSFTASHGNSSTQLIPNGGAREQDNARPPSSNVAASRAKPTPFAISVPTGCFFNRIPSYFPLQFEPSKLSRDSRSIPRISPWSLAAPPRLQEYVGFVDLPCQLRSSCNTQFSWDVKSISIDKRDVSQDLWVFADFKVGNLFVFRIDALLNVFHGRISFWFINRYASLYLKQRYNVDSNDISWGCDCLRNQDNAFSFGRSSLIFSSFLIDSLYRHLVRQWLFFVDGCSCFFHEGVKIDNKENKFSYSINNNLAW